SKRSSNARNHDSATIPASVRICRRRWRLKPLMSRARGDADHGADDVDDAFLRVARHRRPERHREVLLCGPLRLGQRSGLVAEELQRGLEVQRRRVVRRGADAGLAESVANAVALRRPADEEVIDVAGLVVRQVDELAEPELGVAGSGLAAAAVPRVELGEEEAEERSLELVEAGVVAD